MRILEALSFRFDGEDVWILDQTRLPQEKVWLKGTDPDDMIDHIKTLRVRGAPLIGISAAVNLARQAELGLSREGVLSLAERLREARPTAVNLMVAIDRMKAVVSECFQASRLVAEAEKIFFEDQKLCAAIADFGAGLIESGDGVLTHCNTGGLATAGVGTALGIIRRAHESGKKIHVYVDETRPLLQGGRLTTWELQELGIPYTLITDNMAATLMAQGKVQKVFVGADRITLNGDTVNKVGTYGLAVLARHHEIPFYVAAPWTTVDFDMQTGLEVPIEERKADEVRGVQGAFGQAQWARSDAPVYNPAFDMTPAALISGWIFDTGIFSLGDIASGALSRFQKGSDK